MSEDPQTLKEETDTERGAGLDSTAPTINQDDQALSLEGTENPLNWPSRKKGSILVMVSAITFLSPLTSTIAAPATEHIMAEFHSTNDILAGFVTSVQLLGYVCGPMVIAPLSELYGRNPVYHCCNLIFLVFNIACAVAPNLAGLIVFRLLAGIGASCAVTIGAGTIADLVSPEKRGLAMSGWIIGPLLGPTTGPIIGAYLSEAKGWRWVFWLVSILAGAVTILSLLVLRETYAPVLLRRKAKKQGKLSTLADTNAPAANAATKSPAALFASSIVRPLKMLIYSPIVLFLSLYVATIYGYLYLCFTTFPRVFQGQYGFSEGTSGLTYLGIGVGSIIGLFVCGALSDRIVAAMTARNDGKRQPEFRLPLLIGGAILVPIGLFWYGWTADKKEQWILPIIGTAILGIGLIIIMMGSTTYLVDAYTVYAASATAAATIIRSLLGALLPLAGNSMYNALGIGWGTSLLAFIAVAFIPVPVLFWRYGERIRTSKYAKFKS